MTSSTLLPDERLIRPPAIPGSDGEKAVLAELPLAASLNIEGELQFVDELISKYVGTDKKAIAPFVAIRKRVVERQAETRLFLGVIGEFSSGKSTLVNALIRDQLLRTDVLQGTTAAATLLSYGDRLDVVIRRKKKNVVVRAFGAVVSGAKAIASLFSSKRPLPTRDELLHLIHQATSDEEFARDIVQVDIKTPSTSLRKGLVVVDTPGANAANSRHAEVTCAALRDVCDAALVVVPAEAAGAESLFNFLKANADDILYRCVFVVTKIDLIRRERDRDHVLKTLKARIGQQLGVANPRVLACAPQFVIESLDASRATASGEFTAEEIETWVRHFTAMEAELDQVLRTRRLQAQVDDVAKLAMQLLSHLKQILQERHDGYRQRHEALAKIIIPDVDKFIDQRINVHVETCRQGMQRMESGVGREYQAMVDTIVADISKAVGSAGSRKELRTAVEETIPRVYSSGQKDLQRLLKRVLTDMANIGGSELKKFHDEFQQHFRALATLGGSLDIDRVDAKAVARDFSARGEAANREIASELKGLDQQKVFATMGMAAGGAAVGTFIFPGIGTVVGGLLGGLFSMMFGPSLDELKNQCWSKLQPEVLAGLEAFSRSADAAIESTMQSTVHELRQRIASYLPRYQSLVQKMRDRDEEEKRQLAEFQKRIQADLARIEERQQSLEQLRLQLRDV